MNQPNPATRGSKPAPSALVARLTPEVYRAIEAKCKPLDVGSQSTELQVAFTLGQQSVLRILREDLVV